MAPKIILGPNNRYTVLDNGACLLLDVTQKEVEDLFLEEFRKRFWQMAQVIKADALEYDVVLGNIKCCDCGSVVTKYNPSWKRENQRCEKCK